MLIRHYTDLSGQKRKLVFHSKPPFIVPFHKVGTLYSTVTRWIDESGWVTQIPDEIWHNISYHDV